MTPAAPGVDRPGQPALEWSSDSGHRYSESGSVIPYASNMGLAFGHSKGGMDSIHTASIQCPLRLIPQVTDL